VSADPHRRRSAAQHQLLRRHTLPVPRGVDAQGRRLDGGQPRQVDDDGTAATDTGYCQSYPSVGGSS